MKVYMQNSKIAKYQLAEMLDSAVKELITPHS
jgi:hypothetical protein